MMYVTYNVCSVKADMTSFTIISIFIELELDLDTEVRPACSVVILLFFF